MKKHPTEKLKEYIGRLLSVCEAENDFWPNSRHFLEIGEAGLAFEGIYIYLLSRNDLWREQHALTKTIRDSLADVIDFDELELSVMDDGRYSERKATLEWRQTIVRELNACKLSGGVS
ncbi:hypothetical protein [Pseudophaeobacter sp.]|uniref:hypothetical protein n=1 Tax=Pseudophaeobacter sp. TaxID=1971739 RepID=UPI00329753E9